MPEWACARTRLMSVLRAVSWSVLVGMAGLGGLGASHPAYAEKAPGLRAPGAHHRPAARAAPRAALSRPRVAGNAGEWLGYRAGPPRPTAREANAAPPRLPFYLARRGRLTFYVLGTLHAGDPIDYPANRPFRPAIRAALDASPTVAFELSPDDLIDAQADVQRYGRCLYDCLPRQISPSLWRKVAARVGHNPALLAQVARMRPWLAAMVMESYDATSSGLQTDYGSEAQIQNVYLKGRIVGLETLAEQMRAFDTLTLAEQREMLEQDLAQAPQQNAADLRRVHALWRAGDAERLFAWQRARSAQLARDPGVSAAIDDKILFQRNRRFAARMQALAQPRRPVFVAIGALHLGGPRGVLALLRAAGYQVRML
ncbi:TraB/GumN family protein [Robbsia sp. Bb-Pol-6]|uniref:TraB/GumN family protein n=2 Tax=Robbsia betulipollinis TaxID=2981849 RepID=A0ABT3ZKF9_9BURK|nr:TraB/GumN family protein [Robbsia betulipollinis]MCY0386937.1 TraB/GumN family protein [Robbsia betulipollinis]